MIGFLGGYVSVNTMDKGMLGALVYASSATIVSSTGSTPPLLTGGDVWRTFPVHGIRTFPVSYIDRIFPTT